MDRKWAAILALLATGCGDGFEAAPSGGDDSGLDASRDAQGPGVDGSLDGGPADGGGGVEGGGGIEGGGGTDGAGIDDGGKEASGDSGRDAGGDAGRDGSGEAGGDAGNWSPLCPASAPSVGTMCADDTLECEYPSAAYDDKVQYDVACDTVLQCSGGAWSSLSLGAACDPDSANSTACPSSFGGISNGGTCSEKQLRCEYPKGVCVCTASSSSIVTLPPLGDAGATWSCNPESGCPMPRPRLGVACPTEKQSCTYETCSYGQTCEDGVWQGEPEACATPGGV